jgi:hypothetical protein
MLARTPFAQAVIEPLSGRPARVKWMVQTADHGLISGGPVLQRPIVEVVEDRNEMHDECRVAEPIDFPNLVVGDELVKLGEPVPVVHHCRDEAAVRTDRADNANKPAGDVRAQGEGLARGLAFDCERISGVILARRGRQWTRKEHLDPTVARARGLARAAIEGLRLASRINGDRDRCWSSDQRGNIML